MMERRAFSLTAIPLLVAAVLSGVLLLSALVPEGTGRAAPECEAMPTQVANFVDNRNPHGCRPTPTPVGVQPAPPPPTAP
jgi:hypothetical protein